MGQHREEIILARVCVAKFALALAQGMFGFGTQALGFDRIQRIRDVGRQGQQQHDLFRVESGTLLRIQSESAHGLSALVQGEGCGCPDPVSQRRLAPGRQQRVALEVVVHHGPILADAGTSRALAELALDLYPDAAKVRGRGAAGGHRLHQSALDQPDPGQWQRHLLRDDPAHFLEDVSFVAGTDDHLVGLAQNRVELGKPLHAAGLKLALGDVPEQHGQVVRAGIGKQLDCAVGGHRRRVNTDWGTTFHGPAQLGLEHAAD